MKRWSRSNRWEAVSRMALLREKGRLLLNPLFVTMSVHLVIGQHDDS